MGGEEEDLSRGELTVLTVHFVQKETGEGRSRGDRDLTPLSLSLSLSFSFSPALSHTFLRSRKSPLRKRCSPLTKIEEVNHFSLALEFWEKKIMQRGKG